MRIVEENKGLNQSLEFSFFLWLQRFGFKKTNNDLLRKLHKIVGMKEIIRFSELAFIHKDNLLVVISCYLFILVK